jgi:fumarate reductase subunit D
MTDASELDALLDTLDARTPFITASEPPRRLLRRRRSGETVIWWAYSSGRLWRDRDMVWQVLGLAIATTIIVLLWLTSPPDGKTTIALAAGIVGVTLIGTLALTLFPPRREIYGLTNRRIIVACPMPGDIWSAQPERDGLGQPIRALEVSGTRERGTIALGNPSFTLWIRQYPSLRLVGIDRPLEVAQQIKSVLKLDLPIEDHTR